MNIKTNLNRLVVILTCYFACSCEDFLEVDAPNNKLVRQEVFNSDETAISAMQGIYNELFVAAFSSGERSSVSFLAGLSADNLENLSSYNLPALEFQQNEILPDNQHNLDLWSGAYNLIYITNSFLEGLLNSGEISPDLALSLEGEARFVRAFTYFYLVNLYGEVPLVLTTDYRKNNLISRTAVSDIYLQILEDLKLSADLLGPEYTGGERTQINSYTAKALLARIYLYLENWEGAENLSSDVIAATTTYQLLDNPSEVFLANSKEAIWQISPLGDGEMTTHTKEGSLFIIDPVFWFFALVEIPEDFHSLFDSYDSRLSWIGYNEMLDAYYPFKYKIWSGNTFPIQEYSMVLRLSEQYLIRAEARAQIGNLTGAIEDLDVIRKRAGIDLIAETIPTIDQQGLLQLILEERRKELFTEWGHRWFDLKRTGKAGEILGVDNPYWEATDLLFPIPEQERRINPNLTQNPGY